MHIYNVNTSEDSIKIWRYGCSLIFFLSMLSFRALYDFDLDEANDISDFAQINARLST